MRGALKLRAHRGGQRHRSTGHVVEPDVDEESDALGDGDALRHAAAGSGGRRGERAREDRGRRAVQHATIEAQVPVSK